MLTPPKWQTVWLKSQFFSKNISKKTMYSKPADKMLDDLTRCCCSTSKELTLEALDCWRIWIDNQKIDDWKQNEVCYCAVRPLLTKKFHPLNKDSEVCKIKLSLMWLILQKIEFLMNFEGPQHILEVFIQSCLLWLSCSEDMDPEICDLILKLLCHLFSKDVKITEKVDYFPALKTEILQSDKLFCRLVSSFMKIFNNWSKVKDKTDMICIWNHFLDHCEQSFKFIPIPVWHQIFKTVEIICGDENEKIENKIALIHKCATSLKHVMCNSKFIDCNQLLTTPVEALLKITVELCISSADENISFEIFCNCREIFQVLCNLIFHAFGYDSCIYILSKMEDIEVKPLLWGLWCGLACCLTEKLKKINMENYSKTEIKLFRKLRAIAVNFDLDRQLLEEKSISMIESHFTFLRIGGTCRDCLWPGKIQINEKHSQLSVNKESEQCVDRVEGKCNTNEDIVLDLECPKNSEDTFSRKKIDEFRLKNYADSQGDLLPKLNKVLKSVKNDSSHRNAEVFGSEKRSSTYGLGRKALTPKLNIESVFKNSRERKWMRNECSRKLILHYSFWFMNDMLSSERLITLKYQFHNSAISTLYSFDGRESTYENRKFDFSSVARLETPAFTENFIVGNKAEGTESYFKKLRLLQNIHELRCDINLKRNLVSLASSDDELLFALCKFLSVAKSFFIENDENTACEFQRFSESEVNIYNFVKKLCRTDYWRSIIVQKVQAILPKDYDNGMGSRTTSQTSLNCETDHIGLCETPKNGTLLQKFSENLNDVNCPKNVVEETRDAKLNESSVENKKSRPRNRSHACFEKRKSLRISRLNKKLSPKNKLVKNVDVSKTDTLQKRIQTDVQAKRSKIFRPHEYRERHSISSGELHSMISKIGENWKNNESKDDYDGLIENILSEKENEFVSMETLQKPVKNKRRSSNVCGITDNVTNHSEFLNKKTRRRKTDDDDESRCSRCPCKTAKDNEIESPTNIVYRLRRRPLQRPSKYHNIKCFYSCNSLKKKCTHKKGLNDDVREVGVNEASDDPAVDLVSDVPQDADEKNGDLSVSTFGREIFQASDVKKPTPITSDPKASSLKRTYSEDIKTFRSTSEAGDPEVMDVVNFLLGRIEEMEKRRGMDHTKRESSMCFVECENRLSGLDPKVDISLTDGIQVKEVNIHIDISPTNPDMMNSNQSPKRFIKRRGYFLEDTETESAKKLKLDEETIAVKKEPLEINHDTKESLIQLVSNAEDEELSKNPDVAAEESTPRALKSTIQKSNPALMNSRGSRMLSLVPESQKIERILDVSPSSRQHAAKPPNFCKSSRASRMLALLSELQDPKPDLNEPDHTKDKSASRFEGIASGNSAHLGKPFQQSPKRRSIRFDDDKNETLTYFTDSPPCFIARSGSRFRRDEEN